MFETSILKIGLLGAIWKSWVNWKSLINGALSGFHSCRIFVMPNCLKSFATHLDTLKKIYFLPADSSCFSSDINSHINYCYVTSLYSFDLNSISFHFTIAVFFILSKFQNYFVMILKQYKRNIAYLKSRNLSTKNSC